MEIEPPHHPIETRRDFFIHLFTITCGLLIALSLEGLVEWAHHRSLVHEARANIRQEIEDNQKAANKNLASTDKNLQITRSDLATERRLQDQPKGFHGSLNFTFSWDSPSDSAWLTARDTGALGYMPYAEVQRYADLYGEQAKVDSAQDGIYQDDARAYAPIAAGKDPDTMKPAEVQQMIDATALANAHLEFLKQTTTQLRDLYGKTLQAR